MSAAKLIHGHPIHLQDLSCWCVCSAFVIRPQILGISAFSRSISEVRNKRERGGNAVMSIFLSGLWDAAKNQRLVFRQFPNCCVWTGGYLGQCGCKFLSMFALMDVMISLFYTAQVQGDVRIHFIQRFCGGNVCQHVYWYKITFFKMYSLFII